MQVDVTDATAGADAAGGANGLGPRVGVEFHASKGDAWIGLLNRLGAHRLCGAERAVALSGWQRAPAELEAADRTTYTSRLPNDPAMLGEGLPVRLLNHVKLSFMPNGGLEAKIYLYAGFLWRRPCAPDKAD